MERQVLVEGRLERVTKVYTSQVGDMGEAVPGSAERLTLLTIAIDSGRSVEVMFGGRVSSRSLGNRVGVANLGGNSFVFDPTRGGYYKGREVVRSSDVSYN